MVVISTSMANRMCMNQTSDGNPSCLCQYIITILRNLEAFNYRKNKNKLQDNCITPMNPVYALHHYNYLLLVFQANKTFTHLNYNDM